jgi:hypothetical protein
MTGQSKQEEEKWFLSVADARRLGLEVLPSVGKKKKDAFRELLTKAGFQVGGPFYRGGEDKPFFFTNITLRDWLKERDIPFHPEQVFANIFWWPRNDTWASDLYMSVGRKTKNGTTYKVVRFDPHASVKVRQAYKGVWAIAGTAKMFRYLEERLVKMSRCMASDIMECGRLIVPRCAGAETLCSTCLCSAILRSCLYGGNDFPNGDFVITNRDLYGQFGVDISDTTPVINVVDNVVYIRESLLLYGMTTMPQSKHIRFLLEYIALVMSKREASSQGKEPPLPDVPNLMILLEEKKLVPDGGLKEAASIIVHSHSSSPKDILPLFGWQTENHGEIPDFVVGINMMRCMHGCGKTILYEGGCAAIACSCQSEFCRFCGGSALNSPPSPVHPHCHCGQFPGEGHCYVEEGQRRLARLATNPVGMKQVFNRKPLSRLESFRYFLQRAHPGINFPSVLSEEVPPPLPPLPAEAHPAEVRVVEAHPAEVRVVEVPPAEAPFAEVRVVEVPPAEAPFAEVRVVEAHPAEAPFAEVRVVEAHPAEAPFAEVRVVEVPPLPPLPDHEIRWTEEDEYPVVEVSPLPPRRAFPGLPPALIENRFIAELRDAFLLEGIESAIEVFHHARGYGVDLLWLLNTFLD